MKQPITFRVVTTSAKEFGNRIYRRRYRGSECETELLKREFSLSHLFRFTILTVRLDSPDPRPGSFMTRRRRAERVLALQHFVAS